ncbi:D-alanyl-D-alanine carboxypeptidase family protein [Streptomyces sp. ODS05-4]|uniref:D-alanyl-D-alanine carboxypeptidase family protein n=1 Tax=Streptomyces sp. ODS05-4 TaxID=2944939 RepID=UPI00210D07B9|nr:D-alanyl-D-alanine carboxypeptidase [Streptomyces sp. ODS05-4]
MIVSSFAAAALPAVLLLAPAAPRPVEPMEPMPPRPAAAVGAALLHRPGIHVRVPPGVAGPPAVTARSYLVADARSGDVLAARDAHAQLPPASTLKALFALTALPGQSPERQHTVSEHELRGVGDGSSLVGVREEVTYKLADLWRGVFLSSGNDAVRVLAGLNGGWERTAREMEAKARSLGALDTRVKSPDGYDTEGQVSSAYDLAVFGRAGLQNPDFARYAATAEADFPGGGWSYGIRNTNRLLTGDDGVGRYPGVLGIKNGYTTNAGHTLITAARHGSRTLVVTVMNPRSGGAFDVYDEARRLLDWGFAAAPKAQPVGSILPPPQPAAVKAAAPPAPSAGAPGTPAAAAKAPTAPAKPPASSPPAPAASPPAPVAAASAAPAHDGPHLLLPLTLVAAALLAAATLWWLRRRPER